MPFIKITNEGLTVDTSAWDEESLIEGFLALVKKRGFDTINVSCGVDPGPDFGYFPLADRFWRASLCVYFFGVSRFFWERGAGYPEPWLFNARHSIELYLKGFFLYALWFERLQKDHLTTGDIRQIVKLKKKFNTQLHGVYGLYEEYKKKIGNIIEEWNSDKLSDAPKLSKILLSTEGETILNEIDKADERSFRFRYPSLEKKPKTDYLQKLDWKYKNSELLPTTGLPKKAGYFFDHLKVINSLHKLRQEMIAIKSYLGGCWDYIGEIQDTELDLMMEFYRE